MMKQRTAPGYDEETAYRLGQCQTAVSQPMGYPAFPEYLTNQLSNPTPPEVEQYTADFLAHAAWINNHRTHHIMNKLS